MRGADRCDRSSSPRYRWSPGSSASSASSSHALRFRRDDHHRCRHPTSTDHQRDGNCSTTSFGSPSTGYARSATRATPRSPNCEAGMPRRQRAARRDQLQHRPGLRRKYSRRRFLGTWLAVVLMSILIALAGGCRSTPRPASTRRRIFTASSAKETAMAPRNLLTRSFCTSRASRAPLASRAPTNEERRARSTRSKSRPNPPPGPKGRHRRAWRGRSGGTHPAGAAGTPGADGTTGPAGPWGAAGEAGSVGEEEPHGAILARRARRARRATPAYRDPRGSPDRSGRQDRKDQWA